MNFLKHFLLFFPVLLYAQSPDPLLDLENPQGQQQWVDSLYNQMTLKEKVGQLFMPREDDIEFKRLASIYLKVTITLCFVMLNGIHVVIFPM